MDRQKKMKLGEHHMQMQDKGHEYVPTTSTSVGAGERVWLELNLKVTIEASSACSRMSVHSMLDR